MSLKTTCVAYQTDVFGQAENDRFLAREADGIMKTGTLWQDALRGVEGSEYADQVLYNIESALNDLGYTVERNNGVYIYRDDPNG